MLASLVTLLALATPDVTPDCVPNGERDVYIEYGKAVEVCVPPTGSAQITYKTCPNNGGVVEQELYHCVSRRTVTTYTTYWGTNPATGSSCVFDETEKQTMEEVGRRDWNNGESCPPGATDCCTVYSSEWWYEYGEEYETEKKVSTPHKCPGGKWGLKVTTTVSEFQYRKTFVLTQSSPTGNCPTVECGTSTMEGSWLPMPTGSTTTIEIFCDEEPEPLALLMDSDAPESEIRGVLELGALRSGHGSTELPLTCELDLLLF